MANLQESDILTFRNHKGEEKTMTRQEFRNAARGQQHIDHRPELHDTVVKKATPKDKLFELTSINGQLI